MGAGSGGIDGAVGVAGGTQMAAMADAKACLLLAGDVGVAVCASTGEPTGLSLRFPLPPASLRCCGPHALAFFAKAIYVYTLSNGSHVQTLAFLSFMAPELGPIVPLPMEHTQANPATTMAMGEGRGKGEGEGKGKGDAMKGTKDVMDETMLKKAMEENRKLRMMLEKKRQRDDERK